MVEITERQSVIGFRKDLRHQEWRKRGTLDVNYPDGNPTYLAVNKAVEKGKINNTRLRRIALALDMADILMFVYPKSGEEMKAEELDLDTMEKETGKSRFRLNRAIDVLIDAGMVVSIKRKEDQKPNRKNGNLIF